MDALYDEEQVQRLRRRGQRSRELAWGLLILSQLVCVILCTRVRTGNDRLLLAWVIGVSTCGGWAAILILRLRSRPDRVVSAHMAGILANPEAEELAGELRLRPGLVSIPGSIDIRKAELRTEKDTVVLNVLAEKAACLPPDGTRVRVRTVRSYITGWEAEHGMA